MSQSLKAYNNGGVFSEEKIAEFENFFSEVNFLSDQWHEEIYPDMIVQINHKEAYFTHVFHIWINEKTGTRSS